jgi:hypothetical protein
VARNDIGHLNVRVGADTREFVNGMANVQRRTEQTTAVLQKSRQAFGALGGAMRMPGLGRAGAFGGAASGVAGALGLGALGGGVAGLASTAGFSLVSTIIEDVRRREERRLEINKQIAELAERQADAYKEAQEAYAKQVLDAQRLVQGALDPGGTKARDRQQSILEQINGVNAEIVRRAALVRDQEALQFTPFGRDDKLLEEMRANLAESKAALEALVAQFNGVGGNGLGRRLAAAGVQGDFVPLFSGSSPQSELSKQSADGAEATAKKLADVIERAVDEFKRENQRQTDQLATTVNRISSQITQLTYRRD